MPSRLTAAGIVAAALLLAACRDEKVTSYRIPKEQDPTLPGMAADGAAGGGGMGAPGAAMADTAVPTASGPSLVWQAPAEWHPKALSAMRKGSFSVAGEGGEADLSITAFPGDVGGELANVNRWRGQIGLPPLADADLSGATLRFESNGLSFVTVDFEEGGTAAGKRILGAIVPYNGSTWFFKMMGPGALVEKEKGVFLAFLKTVKAAS